MHADPPILTTGPYLKQNGKCLDLDLLFQEKQVDTPLDVYSGDVGPFSLRDPNNQTALITKLAKVVRGMFEDYGCEHDVVIKISTEESNSLLNGVVPVELIHRLADVHYDTQVNGIPLDPITSCNLGTFLQEVGILDEFWGNSVKRMQALMHVLRYKVAMFQWKGSHETQKIFTDLEAVGLIVNDPDNRLNWMPSEYLLCIIRKSGRPVGNY